MAPPNVLEHPVVRLLESLMSIVSTTEQEDDIGLWLEGYLQKLGYTVERIPIQEGSSRHNVYAYLGQTRKNRLLITAHMDTVPPHIPFRWEGDVIWGRGSSDDLGPLAAQITAVEELRKEGQLLSEGDFSFLCVVGEENGGPGMIAANDMNLSWEAGIFAEPTEGKLAMGHKGQVAFTLKVEGVACHSGYPDRGRSATKALLAILNDLSSADWPVSDILGSSTFNIGTLQGGEKHNIVAPSASALCEVRMVDDLPGVKRQIEDIVSKHPHVELEYVFEYPEVLLDWEIAGFDAAPVAFGTDIPRLAGSHKKVLFGPGSILVAHGPDEHIKIPELVDSIAGYKKLILHFLS